MDETNVRLRARLEELERYQLLLKFDHAELEVLLLQKRLVEGQLKLEAINCSHSRQLEIFGRTGALVIGTQASDGIESNSVALA